MNPRHLGLLMIASATTALAAACSSSTAGSANPASGLGARLQHGLETVRTAHVAFVVTTAGRSITGSGNEELAGGKLRALDLSETIPGVGPLQLIVVKGATYAKLPQALTHLGKPYVLVSTNSTNPAIRSIANSIASAQSSASIGSVGVFVNAAASVKDDGSQNVNGTATTHYSVVVDPAKLPSSFPGRAAILQAGLHSIPVELYIDSAGRPVEATEHIVAAGQTADTKITVSEYNKPVTIAAPPRDQVTSG